MKTKQEHTAIPWQLSRQENIENKLVIEGTKDCRDSLDNSYYPAYEPVCFIHESGQTNAKFIVRACNAHEALVKACTWALEHLELIEKEDALNDDEEFGKKLVESALKLAEREG